MSFTQYLQSVLLFRSALTKYLHPGADFHTRSKFSNASLLLDRHTTEIGLLIEDLRSRLQKSLIETTYIANDLDKAQLRETATYVRSIANDLEEAIACLGEAPKPPPESVRPERSSHAEDRRAAA